MSIRARLLVLGLLVALPAAGSAAREPHPERDEALIAERGLPPETVGFVVYDLSSGERILAHRPDTPFVPASAIKAPVSLAAMHILGQDHRFETTLHATGTVRGGVLRGDLYLRGGGDPMLLTDDLVGFVERLQALGIERVAGAFHYDDSRIPLAGSLQPDHEQDVGYNPAVAGLALNFNRVRIDWQRGAEPGTLRRGRALAITDRHQHVLDYLTVAVSARPLPRYPTFRYERTEAGGRWAITPRAGHGGNLWAPVKQPGRYAAGVFRALAAEMGVVLPVPTRAATPPDARLLHRHRSIPVSRISHKMLRFSNNLVAEMLGANAARTLSGAPLPLDASAARIAGWWRRRLPDTDWTGFALENHSGLAESTRITAEQLAATLRFAARHEYEGRSYVHMLHRYTLARPQRALARYAWVRGKTGTMDYVRALAGYMGTNGRREYVFAVLIADNDRVLAEARRERLPTDAERRRARRWNARARELLRDLVFRWLREL